MVEEVDLPDIAGGFMITHHLVLKKDTDDFFIWWEESESNFQDDVHDFASHLIMITTILNQKNDKGQNLYLLSRRIKIVYLCLCLQVENYTMH